MMKTNNYFFVVGIVGAIIAGGYSLGEMVDINSFEVLPEAEAHTGISGATGDYFKYASGRISAGYNKWVSVSCNSGDRATGFFDYHNPTLELYKSYPWWSWDPTHGANYLNGMQVQYYNTASYSQLVYLFVFCSAR